MTWVIISWTKAKNANVQTASVALSRSQTILRRANTAIGKHPTGKGLCYLHIHTNTLALFSPRSLYYNDYYLGSLEKADTHTKKRPSNARPQLDRITHTIYCQTNHIKIDSFSPNITVLRAAWNPSTANYQPQKVGTK